MKKFYSRHFFVYVMACLWLFTSCDFSLNRSRQYSIVSPDANIANIPTDDFFYVNIKSAFYTGGQGGFDPLDFLIYAMDEGPGTDCKISVNEAPGTEDLYCMLDVAEGDLWYHEINLEYNIPPGMCAYAGFTPHWHYNQEVGEGPPYVVASEFGTGNNRKTVYSGCDSVPKILCEQRTKNRPEPPEEGQNSRDHSEGSWPEEGWGNASTTYTCPSAGDDGCVKAGREGRTKYEDEGGNRVDNEGDAVREYRCQKFDRCSANVSGHRSRVEDEQKVCKYNLSDKKGKGNCCLGEYTVLKEGESSEEKEWGGDIKTCIGGLGRLEWPTEGFNEAGFPITVVEESGSRGVNKEYKLNPLIEKIKTRASFPTANYFEGVEEKEGVSGLPDFYTIGNTCGGGARCPTAHPYLTWTCLDKHQNILHQINFVIREWNTQEEFIRFKENGSGDPDIVGAEGSECDFYESEEKFQTHHVFGRCNDILSADDKDNDSSRWNDYGLKDPYPEINYEGNSGS